MIVLRTLTTERKGEGLMMLYVARVSNKFQKLDQCMQDSVYCRDNESEVCRPTAVSGSIVEADSQCPLRRVVARSALDLTTFPLVATPHTYAPTGFTGTPGTTDVLASGEPSSEP